MSAAIDFGGLLKLLWAAPLAALTVTCAFAFAIHGLAHATDARREGRPAAAFAYLVLAGTALLVFAGTVTYGLLILITD